MFEKWLKLPQPPQALPMRCLTGGDQYCWEDYYADLKNKYPIRYFIYETIPLYYARWVWSDVSHAPLQKLIYWLKCHILPSYKFHLIDIRQSKQDGDRYEYGWIDTDQKLVLACKKLFMEYVEKELEGHFPEIEGSCGEYYQEIKTIYNYWKVERPSWQAKINTMRQNENSYILVDAEHQAFEQKETEILNKIIELRGGMWT